MMKDICWTWEKVEQKAVWMSEEATHPDDTPHQDVSRIAGA